MNAHTQEDEFAGARKQAQAQYESIRGMVEALRAADEAAQPTANGDYDDACEDARRAIDEDPLSVEVRSGWVSPGAWDAAHGRDRAKPEEYCILLCTGGPAVRIVGELSEHCEPETARLEMQDWFLPWTEYRPTAQAVLLAYARCFWYGE